MMVSGFYGHISVRVDTDYEEIRERTAPNHMWLKLIATYLRAKQFVNILFYKCFI